MTDQQRSAYLTEIRQIINKHTDLALTCSTMGEMVAAMPTEDAERLQQLVVLTNTERIAR